MRKHGGLGCFPFLGRCGHPKVFISVRICIPGLREGAGSVALLWFCGRHKAFRGNVCGKTTAAWFLSPGRQVPVYRRLQPFPAALSYSSLGTQPWPWPVSPAALLPDKVLSVALANSRPQTWSNWTSAFQEQQWLWFPHFEIPTCLSCSLALPP